MRIQTALALFLLIGAAPFALAQEPSSPKPLNAYRVKFSFHEFQDGKRVSTKDYTILLEDGYQGSIRVGNKVPVTSPGALQYMDVGMNLNCTLRERDSLVSLKAFMDVNNVDIDQQGKPALRQIRTDSSATVTPGKPITIITLDDFATKKHYEVEATATKVAR